jgi:hypothetical protein
MVPMPTIRRPAFIMAGRGGIGAGIIAGGDYDGGGAFRLPSRAAVLRLVAVSAGIFHAPGSYHECSTKPDIFVAE